MLFKPFRARALACLCLASQLTDARFLQPVLPRDGGSPAPGQGSLQFPTATGIQAAADVPLFPTPTAQSASNGEPRNGRRTTSLDKPSVTTPFASGSSSSSSSVVYQTTIYNGTYSTVPEGELPLKPRITPGWAVAGVIMILSGLFYTLIGIKNGYLHAFFSMAYISSLGVTVLIVYVMNLPVSNAAQGGYVVAVVLAGSALGGGSAFFKELTEGLGCALGGFCIGMWLLCLVPGGLLAGAAAKAIFIAGFTLVGFAFYFSRWTRDWAMIVLIAFSGSTVVVLGIDCYSRAGLKEFWAWVWDLNDNLFPLGSDTYPITKGIRVEAALIIIFGMAGIISQIKLWRILREQRRQKAANRAEGQRDLEAEEENVGRIVQEQTERDRAEWEKVYGNGTGATKTESRVSGSISVDKDLRTCQSVSTLAQSRSEGLEKSDAASASGSRDGDDPLKSSKGIEDGKITILVACEESVAEGEETMSDEKAIDSGLDRKEEQDTRQQTVVCPPPKIVPLPFRVPHAEDDDAATKASANRSSFATFADEDTANGSVAGDARHDDQKSVKAHNPSAVEDQRSSLAATLDDDSLSIGRQSTVSLGNGTTKRRSKESTRAPITAEKKTSGKENGDASVQPPQDTKAISGPEKAHVAEVNRDQTSKDANAVTKVDEPVKEEPAMEPCDAQEETAEIQEKTPEVQEMSVKKAVPASLTKIHLPKSLSKVALSYRTNEWAKHLSLADAPEPDEIRVRQNVEAIQTDIEVARAVDVEDLQKTAEHEALPCATVKRADAQRPQSSASLQSPTQGASSSRALALPGRAPGGLGTISERRGALLASPLIRQNTEEIGDGPVSPTAAQPVEASQRSPVSGVISFSSPQTLLGQREQYLRNKSQGNLLCQSPEPALYGEVSPLGGEGDLLFNYSMYAAALTYDPDNVPLSQRKDIIRRGSAANSGTATPVLPRSNSGVELSESAKFNSHQPKRMASVSTRAAREAKLANFRQSVAHDLRSPGAGVSLGGSPLHSPTSGYFNVDKHRSYMVTQMDADGQRKEQRRRDKDARDSMMDDRMRGGNLIQAHREAMRRMQNSAKES